MAVDIMYLNNGTGVFVRQCGIVTGKEIIAAQNKIYQHHLCKYQQYYIIDKSWCTEYNVTAADIKSISLLDKRFAKFKPDMIIAIIESKYLNFSLTELWQTHIENDIKYSKSFSNQVEALKWIKACISLN